MGIGGEEMEGFNQRRRGAGGGCRGGGGSPGRRYGGCYGGSRRNDSMLRTFSGVCLRSNPEALHTSVSFCPCAVLSSAQHLPKRSVSLITHTRRIERSATHIQQLQALRCTPLNWRAQLTGWCCTPVQTMIRSFCRCCVHILILQNDLILKRTEK